MKPGNPSPITRLQRSASPLRAANARTPRPGEGESPPPLSRQASFESLSRRPTRTARRKVPSGRMILIAPLLSSSCSPRDSPLSPLRTLIVTLRDSPAVERESATADTTSSSTPAAPGALGVRCAALNPRLELLRLAVRAYLPFSLKLRGWEQSWPDYPDGGGRASGSSFGD